jgi:molybdopterin-containing oxidoreductase family membrane subunit
VANKIIDIEQRILEPLFPLGKWFYVIGAVLITLLLVGAYGWLTQLQQGLIVTGLNQRVFWGIYMSNFIFFIGISYSGTLISAILRLTGAEWRKPLTRMAEGITVIGILVGFAMIIIDMGRVDRILLLPLAARLQSPLFWDFLSVSTYLTGSFFFLYLPMIPDIAILRDRFNSTSIRREEHGMLVYYYLVLEFNFRKYLYRFLAMRWHGSKEQKKRLERGISYMTVILIPVAVSCHTVIAFIFAMTWRVGWHSTIFGPYFVVAAIFSGTAAILIAMCLIRRFYHFEDIITHKSFRNLGLILFSLLSLYFYFTLTEYLTSAYRAVEHDMELLQELFFYSYAPQFWTFIVAGMIIPGIALLLACWKYKHELSIWVIAISSALVVFGMWLKRSIIVIPALARPFVEREWSVYAPTWVEIWITIAALAGFVLAYMIFIKLFPVISIWELTEEEYIEEESVVPGRSVADAGVQAKKLT